MRDDQLAAASWSWPAGGGNNVGLKENTVSKFLKTAVLVLAASAVLGSAAAEAKVDLLKNESISIAKTYLSNPPAMVFVPKNGKYEAEKTGSYNVKVHFHAERRLTAKIWQWRVEEQYTNTRIADNGFQDVDLKTLDKTFNLKIDWNFLKQHEAKARKVCETHGKPNEKVIKTDNEVRLYYTGTAWAKTNNSSDSSTVAAVIPINIVCMPEPFEVKDVDLKVEYKGSNAKCPVHATLKAKFTTNKPGKNKFTFILVRGDGSKQEIDAETFGSGQQSIALWHKDYTFNKSENRKYMIIVKGSPISTNWVPMKANCGEGIGGFNSAPKPNTD